MRRSKSLRVSVAIVLLLTLVLVNRHVASIEPAQPEDLASEFVIDAGQGHIELVSSDRRPRGVAESAPPSSYVSALAPHSRTMSNSAASPTVQGWLEPTKPAPPIKFAPKQIPVYVPGQEYWDFDYDLYPNEYREDVQLGQRHKNKGRPTTSSPPKPKVTPKSDRIVVLGRMSYEDTSWLEEELPE